MKSLFSFLLFILAPMLTSAQAVALGNDRQNVVYLGIDNPMTIVAEGYPCKSLIIVTDNGSITGWDGHYIFSPSHISGGMHIQVKVKTPKGIKEVANFALRVTCITVDRGFLFGKENGDISAQNVVKSVGPSVPILGYEVDAACHVLSFTTIIERYGVEILHKQVSRDSTTFSANFSTDKEVQKMIASLKPGDILKIEDLKACCFPECIFNCKQMQFTITE